MLILVTIIVVSFFLPWVSVELKSVSKLIKILSSKSESSFIKISGFRIPILANSKDADLIITIAKIFKPDIQNVKAKSWLVWAVPILALIIYLLVKFFGRSKLLNFLFMIIGWTIFIIGYYKVSTIELDRLVINIKIERGFWLLLWGYLGIGILSMLYLLKPEGRRNKFLI